MRNDYAKGGAALEIPGPPLGAPSIRIQKVEKHYGRATALAGVSFNVGPGVTALLGRNGAGKSTLVKIIVGIEKPSAGDVTFVDRETLDRRSRLRQTGWLPQVFGYPPAMRVGDFLAYAAWLKEVRRKSTAQAVDAAAERAQVGDVMKRRMRTLSGGTLRRVGLAAALVNTPQFLILDEPTAGLDPEQRDRFHKTLMELDDVTVLVSTHLLEDVETLAAEIFILDDGSIAWQGTVPELAQHAEAGSSGVGALRSGFMSLLPPR